MEEKDYSRLIEICDQVLLDKEATLATISIPWLHILNEHPNSLPKYSELFNQGAFNELKWKIKYLLFKALAFIRVFKFKRYSPPSLKPLSTVIVSHLLNEKQIQSKEDFYFGNLHQDLQMEGVSSHMVLLNHTSKESKQINANFSLQESSKSVLSNYLGFRIEWEIWKTLEKESAKFISLAKQQKDGFLRKFYFQCAYYSISPPSFASIRFYRELKSIFEMTIPNTVFSTFEGHSWERMVYSAAREANPKVRCIGYHHTLMFQRQHAAKRVLGKMFDPSYILTAGDITASYFKSSAIANYSEVLSVGIHRRKSFTRSLSEEKFKKKENYCLIAPDGIISEIIFMFDFAIKSALINPNINFILRLHPLVSSNELIKDYPRFGQLPQNVLFSSTSLESDFERSRWIFYRASSTAIYAVIEGIRPFYLSKENEMSIDTLFALDSWKRIIKSEYEAKDVFEGDLNKSITELIIESKIAFDFCNNYFLPLKKELILNLVK
ncbi:hypothetical protein [Aquirufa aurantiipilula]|uniref:Uncharacterized protein n=1 Tax=Aquirufa aurantiipilula TaxID=2696561 RepID=A0ABT6BK71_9BACT|nr:hypothetical protein [Aquirufa aurantiipilula]MDF5690845.1 hypothetical protein [Aquirufa aurantiipilula]